MNVLRNMYKKIMARIKIGTQLCEQLQDESGTHQGGPLSPIMFHEMLNYLKEYLDEMCVVVINAEAILQYFRMSMDREGR